jgi:serine/threonine-protein kinase
MLAVEPTFAEGTSFVASALFAQGSPLTAIREILRKRRDLLPEADRATAERDDGQALAVLSGDFLRAETLARAAYDAIRESTVATDHGHATRILVSILREMGKTHEASLIGAEFLAGRDAWEPNARLDDWALSDDPTPLALLARMEDGAVSRTIFERDRARTIDRWTARIEEHLHAFIWIDGYAIPSETPELAKEAIDALPTYLPLPPYTPLTLASFDIGRTSLLGGRVDDALPWLEKAAKNCFPLDHPIENTRAHFFLGQAREAKGDKDGACAAYGVVRERWGSAKPRSVTAEKALTRVKALGCK